MSAEDEKAARLSAALRANLARRKAQTRARKALLADDKPAPQAAPDTQSRAGRGTQDVDPPAPAPAERAPPDGTIVPDDEAG